MIFKNQNYHTPVLLRECIEHLSIKPEGVYVDATFGGGGHSRSILNQMNAKGRLFGFDQDEQAVQNILPDPNFVFVRANFKFLRQMMEFYGVQHVDGVLADLGVSSHHFDEAERGFSYRFDAALDMRMNQSGGISAGNVLNEYSQQELQRVLSEYGELRNARSFSKLICEERRVAKLNTVAQLLDVIERLYIGDRIKYAAQVFQAIRIEVNNEMVVLEDFLNQAIELLGSQGRLVVISYHSIEDKVVKKVMKHHVSKRDEFGRSIADVKLVLKKPLIPSEEEVLTNSRAASAKLRVLEKL